MVARTGGGAGAGVDQRVREHLCAPLAEEPRRVERRQAAAAVARAARPERLVQRVAHEALQQRPVLLPAARETRARGPSHRRRRESAAARAGRNARRREEQTARRRRLRVRQRGLLLRLRLLREGQRGIETRRRLRVVPGRSGGRRRIGSGTGSVGVGGRRVARAGVPRVAAEHTRGVFGRKEAREVEQRDVRPAPLVERELELRQPAARAVCGRLARVRHQRLLVHVVGREQLLDLRQVLHIAHVPILMQLTQCSNE